MQAGLAEVTSRRTVPQVFIGGKHVGGCDGARWGARHGVGGVGGAARPTAATKPSTARPHADTLAAHKSGQLKKMLEGVGMSV